jgi:hypothetical protein
MDCATIISGQVHSLHKGNNLISKLSQIKSFITHLHTGPLPSGQCTYHTEAIKRFKQVEKIASAWKGRQFIHEAMIYILTPRA